MRERRRAELEQQIDPNAYYLLYGDDTEQGNDAASIRNLYVRVERKQFYAMFGDFEKSAGYVNSNRFVVHVKVPAEEAARWAEPQS